jgi:hypothetical protein
MRADGNQSRKCFREGWEIGQRRRRMYVKTQSAQERIENPVDDEGLRVFLFFPSMSPALCPEQFNMIRSCE